MNVSEDARVIYQGHRQNAHASIWLSRLRTGLERFSTYMRARRQHARQIHELHAFSDRELWDIGLGRSDLSAISNGTYSRD